MNTKTTQTGVEEIRNKEQKIRNDALEKLHKTARHKIPSYYFDKSLTESQKIEKDWEIINRELEEALTSIST